LGVATLLPKLEVNILSMPQLTLSVPREKLPVLQKFLQEIGIRYDDDNELFKEQGDQAKLRKHEKTFPESSRQSFYDWDYYSCELEFE
jgi:hypothetical protein